MIAGRERLGLTLSPTRDLGWDGLIHIAHVAEELGYHSLWIPETWGADAISVLTVIARETDRILIASGVLNVYSRSAMLIAQSAAALQSLSHGRFVLGLGASGPGVIENWHGLPYSRPVRRTREYVAAIRLALAGDPVNYAGAEFTLHGFRLLDPPAQRIPIYIAALGPKNVSLTGEVAEGWLPIFAARGHLNLLVDALRAGAEKAKRPLSDIDIAAYIPTAMGPRAEGLLRAQIAYYVGGMGTFYAGMLANVGFSDDVKPIRDAWSVGDRRRAAGAVSTRLLDACTVVGDAGEARRRLAAYRQEGIALPILAPPRGATIDETLAAVQALAPGKDTIFNPL